MHPLILSTLVLVAASGPSFPQAAPATSPAQTSPSGLTGARALAITVLVTDGAGAPLADVAVRAVGPVTREGRTASDGTVRFANVKAGIYRVLFSREAYIAFEREVTIKTGQPTQIDATLTPAPPPPAPPRCQEVSRTPGAPVPSAGVLPGGPVGEPNTVAVPAFVEANFIGRAPRKDSRLGCTGTGTAALVQLREAIVEQVDERTDLWLYVIAGEATLRVEDREESLAAGTFSVVPRTMKHSIVPRGRNPLILIFVRTGEPCGGT